MQIEYVIQFYKIINNSFCNLSFARQYITEISLHVTLSNQSHSLSHALVNYIVVSGNSDDHILVYTVVNSL